MDKPITQIKRLLGFSTTKEVATFFGLTVDTANSLNSGRGSKNLRNAYQRITLLLEHIPADERRDIFNPPKPPVLTLSQKVHRIDKLKKRMAKFSGQTSDNLNQYIEAQKEYEKLIGL